MSKDTALVVDAVLQAMHDRPDDFSVGERVLEDKRSKLRFWINSGPSYAGICDPYKLDFGWLQGRRFLRAIDRFKVRNAMLALFPPQEETKGE